METELAALASAGATTIVTLLATDAWGRAKTAVASLWQRVRPNRQASLTAEAVAVEVDVSRSELMAAREADDQHATARTTELVTDRWRDRLAQLLQADPELAVELRRLLDEELRPLLPAAEAYETNLATPTVMRAKASGHARVYQAGRDQQIIER